MQPASQVRPGMGLPFAVLSGCRSSGSRTRGAARCLPGKGQGGRRASPQELLSPLCTHISPRSTRQRDTPALHGHGSNWAPFSLLMLSCAGADPGTRVRTHTCTHTRCCHILFPPFTHFLLLFKSLLLLFPLRPRSRACSLTQVHPPPL